MPNWVQSYIKFEGSQSNIDKVFERIRGLGNDERDNIFDFNRLIPMPNGETDSYSWHIDHWGTKWNAYEATRDDSTLYFQTAWSWPELIMDMLAEICYKYDVECSGKWADEDCGANTGEFYSEGGRMIRYYHASDTSEAYEAYKDCWNEDICIGQTDDGEYFHYKCDDNCPNRDKCRWL